MILRSWSRSKPFLKIEKVVGMGEATHRHKGILQHESKEMFKFLATCIADSRIFFHWKQPMGVTLKVNDYVLYGKGNVLSAMKGMEFWTSGITEEVKDLIEWDEKIQMMESPTTKSWNFMVSTASRSKVRIMPWWIMSKEFDKQKPGHEFLKGLSVLNDSSLLYFYMPQARQIFPAGNCAGSCDHFVHSEMVPGKRECYIPGSGKPKFELARYNIVALKQALLLRESPETKIWFHQG